MAGAPVDAVRFLLPEIGQCDPVTAPARLQFERRGRVREPCGGNQRGDRHRDRPFHLELEFQRRRGHRERLGGSRKADRFKLRIADPRETAPRHDSLSVMDAPHLQTQFFRLPIDRDPLRFRRRFQSEKFRRAAVDGYGQLLHFRPVAPCPLREGDQLQFARFLEFNIDPAARKAAEHRLALPLKRLGEILRRGTVPGPAGNRDAVKRPRRHLEFALLAPRHSRNAGFSDGLLFCRFLNSLFRDGSGKTDFADAAPADAVPLVDPRHLQRQLGNLGADRNRLHRTGGSPVGVPPLLFKPAESGFAVVDCDLQIGRMRPVAPADLNQGQRFDLPRRGEVQRDCGVFQLFKHAEGVLFAVETQLQVLDRLRGRGNGFGGKTSRRERLKINRSSSERG